MERNPNLFSLVNQETKSSILFIPIPGLLFLSSPALGSRSATKGESSIDVEEGETVRLECRFPPDRAGTATLYWIRTNRNGHDNVAIDGTPYGENYR